MAAQADSRSFAALRMTSHKGQLAYPWIEVPLGDSEFQALTKSSKCLGGGVNLGIVSPVQHSGNFLARNAEPVGQIDRTNALADHLIVQENFRGHAWRELD